MNKLICFLGTGQYHDCIYQWTKNDQVVNATQNAYVQIAIVELLQKQKVQIDEMIIYVTKEAYAANWDGPNKLSEQLANYENAPSYRIEHMESTQNEQSIWRLFQQMNTIIEPNDAIYLDITHSFRSFPFMAMPIFNHLRTVKNVQLGGVFYGCYEERVPMKFAKEYAPGEIPVAPLYDLASLAQVFDWTNGFDAYLRTGDASLINATTTETFVQKRSIPVTYKKLTEKLSQLTDMITTCRGHELQLRLTEVKKALLQAKEQSSVEYTPLIELFDKIEQRIGSIHTDDMFMHIDIATWCAEHNLVQQGYTFLREGITTALCTAFALDQLDKNMRYWIDSAFYNLNDTNAYLQRLREQGLVEADFQQFERMMMFLTTQQTYAELITEQIKDARNDINHAGMKKGGARSSKALKSDLLKYIEQLLPFFTAIAQQKK